ncbi:hypothetical protein N3C_2388 [Clostridium sp. N3C]|uniref:DUF4446 family protein n=1 Tax=Clostridium sp. N3C TaxID=1776758 RepID=UPI00092E0D4F|nr:DUF4446 family protein [Clostridium sp. N3C]SCN25590.1 hypothetical protein N3C_2388 [Clostridium sp. N3C]
METLNSVINNNIAYILTTLVIINVILIICVFVLFRSLGSLERRYRKLVRGTNNKNLEEIIDGYMDKVDYAVNTSEEIKEMLVHYDKELKKCTQKVSILRYKAFDDVGSDLSFSIAMLDGDNNGIIITSIYGRHDSTTYAKPVDKGISRYDLSEEEERVLKEAMSK